jgi:hypothetical protein
MLRAEAPVFEPTAVAAVPGAWYAAPEEVLLNRDQLNAGVSPFFLTVKPDAKAEDVVTLQIPKRKRGGRAQEQKQEKKGDEVLDEEWSWAGGGSEFKLSGLEDLQKSLASLLTGKLTSPLSTAEGASPSSRLSLSSTSAGSPGGSSTPRSRFPSEESTCTSMSRQPSEGREDFQEESVPLPAPPGLEEYVAKVAKTEEEAAPAPAVTPPADKASAAPRNADAEALPPLPARARRATPVPEETQPAVATSFVLNLIPKRCSRDVLLGHLKEFGFNEDVDFLYLPVDLKTMSNVGHVVLNFRSEEAVERFSKVFHGVAAKELFRSAAGGSPKGRCEVVPAPVQGREANVRKLRQSGLLMSMLACKPAWLPLVRDEEDLLVPLPDEPESSA